MYLRADDRATDDRSTMSDGDDVGTDVPPGRSRTSSLFTGLIVGALALVLMLVFVLQNDESQDYELLWWDATLRSGVAMLLAAAFGALAVGLVAVGRLLQLRRAARRHRHDHHV
jgi:uncharacterized integral membrane protein